MKGSWLATVPEDQKPVFREITEPSKTQQQFKEESSISYMVKKFGIANMPRPMEHFAFFADVSQIGDLADAEMQLRAAEEMFQSIPADIRARFGNDKYELLAFLEDEDNYEEGVELGILRPKDAEKPAPAGATAGAEGSPQPPQDGGESPETPA